MRLKDFWISMGIGAAVGILTQPIATNILSPGALIRALLFLAFLASAPIALGLAAFIARRVPVVYEMAKFATIGVLNTFIDLGVLNLEIFISGQASGLAFGVFKTVSFAIATINSYIWNKYWTFHADDSAPSGEVIKFYAVSVAAALVNVGVASLVVNVLVRPEFLLPVLWANIGAVAGTLSALLVNFLGYKYLVFGRKGVSDKGVSGA